ncbi:MAG: putative toxin-antitoxin system toxin component, PIN family [Syntrophus sp. (in: bacteria)]|nr:putative toxin-antitoxin system toxin component, PIN family [Syntrophus sp. (in: bacteria)]
MIKIVVDTNVAVSAYLVSGGKPARILSLVKTGQVDIFLSPQIVTEIERTLLRPKLTKIHKSSPKEIGRFIKALEEIVTITPGTLEVDVIADDPDDNKILACAIECRADYVVSGYHHLTDLKEYKGIRVVDPNTFLSVIAGR